jgi:hypothetical protein
MKMATAEFGVNATKIATGPTGSNILGQGTACAGVYAMYDEYEADALTTGSTITMGSPLPIGARILNVILYTDDMGSTVTCDVGDAGDTDRYLDGIDVTNANDVHSLLGAGTRLGEIDGFGYVITGTNDQQILITTAGVWGGTVKLVVIYAL